MDHVNQVFAKLSEVLSGAGILVTDDDKAEQIAKLLGLVKGVRKVGGLIPTDTGYLFAGVNPDDIKAAKEKAALQAEIDRLTQEVEARKAKLAGK